MNPNLSAPISVSYTHLAGAIGIFESGLSCGHRQSTVYGRQGDEPVSYTHLAKAYALAAGEDESAAAGIIEKYRNQYKVSIEDFAEQAQAYIETQVPNFRLNFFVDEVGQYLSLIHICSSLRTCPRI